MKKTSYILCAISVFISISVVAMTISLSNGKRSNDKNDVVTTTEAVEHVTKKPKDNTNIKTEYAVDKYIGKTVQDVINLHGTNYEVTWANGYLMFYYDDCPYHFYFTDYLGKEESIRAGLNGVRPKMTDIITGFFVENGSMNKNVEVFRGIKIGDSKEKIEKIYDIYYDTGIIGGKSYIDDYIIDWTFMLGSNHEQTYDDKLVYIGVIKSKLAELKEGNDQEDYSLYEGEKFEISGVVEYSNEPCDIGMEYCCITDDAYYDYYYYDTNGNYNEYLKASPQNTFYTRGNDTEKLKKYIGQNITIEGEFATECHGIPYITNVFVVSVN